MQWKIDELLKELEDKSQEPSCDEICLEQNSHQPSYDQFRLITIVKSQNSWKFFDVIYGTFEINFETSSYRHTKQLLSEQGVL